MFDTLDEIRAQIRAGEDSLAEFKELRFGERGVLSPNAEETAGELVAFANAEGGAVFLGVDDKGTVCGLPAEKAALAEQWVLNLATHNCDPPIRPILRKVSIPAPDGQDALVLLAIVPKSLFVHRTSGGRWYLRVGSTKRNLTQQELARLFQQRGRLFVFDETPVYTAMEADLDREAVDRFFGGGIAIPSKQLWQNARIMGEDGEGTLRPTVAGLLAFGPKPREHLPSAYIEAAVYRGTVKDSDALVHAEAIDGSVDRQIDLAVAFVERFMLKPARKKIGREDFPQYSLSPVYEATVNAVAHRDYSITGSKIRLFLFDDRLELASPGGLPNTLTLETLPYRQYTRNQLLVSFLSRLRSRETGRAYIEARGEGVRRIIAESVQHSGREPEYCLQGDELLLTIWAKPSPHGAVR